MRAAPSTSTACVGDNRVMRLLDEIDERLAAWTGRQPMYFVGSAPLAGDGHVNISPKGPGVTLQVLAPREVAYLDYTGSGAETTAHLRENGRIVVMFCAFEGPPQIARLHGTGEVVEPGDPRFDGLLERFPQEPLPRASLRSIIRVDVERVATSCGFSVSLLSFVGVRLLLLVWLVLLVCVGGPEAREADRVENNTTSIDGLPSVPVAGD